jgi:anti-sigma regulatory factor (Ser/Thr protein kinase)
MARVRVRGEAVRRFILDNVEQHPTDISKITADHFRITRQAVNKHLQRLKSEFALTETGVTRNRAYKLAPLVEWSNNYPISPDLAEDIVWRNDIKSVLGQQPGNVLDIWHYGFTEMFNNALDHSAASQIRVDIRKTAVTSEMVVWDDGVGIFKKIQAGMNLLDERHAVLELAKGKLTTDPKHHTGEGIFFTSRMFDSFDILSGGVYFSHKFGESEDWILDGRSMSGTSVWMKLNNHTSRTLQKIFSQFTSDDGDFGFTKTVVPVKLAQYGDDKLISRSQAKRLLARVELFKTVVFDFKDISSIGQAFADEIFRVFRREHPEVELVPIRANSEVKRIIQRVTSSKTDAE